MFWKLQYSLKVVKFYLDKILCKNLCNIKIIIINQTNFMKNQNKISESFVLASSILKKV